MRLEYQKKVLNNLQGQVYEEGFGFDWAALGSLIVEGGLPKSRSIARSDLSEYYAFAKNNLTEDFTYSGIIRSVDVRSSPDKVALDLYHHQRYISLEYLREILNELQVRDSTAHVDDFFIFKVSILKRKILRLEQDLQLYPGQVVLPGKYFRFLPHKPTLLREYLNFIPTTLPQAVSHSCYKSATLKRAKFNLKTPYVLPVFPRFSNIVDRKQSYTRMFDANYWSLVFFKSTCKGPTFLAPFRKLIYILLCDKMTIPKRETRSNEFGFLIKYLRQHLQQIRSFKKYRFYKKSRLLTKHYCSLVSLKDYSPYSINFSSIILNTDIYTTKGFWRSLSLAHNNRQYILASSKIVPLNYKFKIDVQHFEISNNKKITLKPELNVFSWSGFPSQDIGAFNLIKLLVIGTKRLLSLDRYSEIPTSDFPYWTRHHRTKRRLRLKDTAAGLQIQDVRNSVFQSIRQDVFKGPIYVTHPTKKHLSGLALFFLNYSTCHHHRIRSENSSYSTRERRLHRLLIVQGVIFEYWVNDPNLMLPGQQVQVQLQNLKIDKEYPSIPASELAFAFDFIESSRLENFESYKARQKGQGPDLSDELSGSYIKKLKIYKFLAFFSPFVGRAIIFLRFIILFPFSELKMFFCLLSDWFNSFFIGIYEFFVGLTRSNFFLRIQTIITVWNTSSAAEDSMFDIKDHYSASLLHKHGKRRPFFTNKQYYRALNLSYLHTHLEEPNRYDLKRGASRLYTDKGFWRGWRQFNDDFLDEVIDFFIVNLPYYVLLFLRPIINLILIYPIWSVLDLVCLLYTQVKADVLFWYDTFLLSSVNKNFKRFIIISRWLFKSFVFFGYVSCWLLYFDYNELQLLVTYTFDVQFHEFYYTTYVMFVVVTGFYFFGHHSFRTFLRDELGYENLLFLVTCTGSVVVQGYEISPKPFSFTKQVYNHIRPKNTNSSYKHMRPFRTFEPDEKGYGGTFRRSAGPLQRHYAYDDLEFSVQTQRWNNNPHGTGFLRPDFNARRIKDIVKYTNKKFTDHHKYGFSVKKNRLKSYDNEQWYFPGLVSDYRRFSTRDKHLKTPLTWYNNREHYYHYKQYNKDGRNFHFPLRRELQDKVGVNRSVSTERANSFYYVGKRSKVRPGRRDKQVKRLDQSTDPALFSSDSGDF